MFSFHTQGHSTSQGFSRQNVNSTGSRTPLSVTPRNVKRSLLAAFGKIRNVFSLTYAQMIA